MFNKGVIKYICTYFIVIIFFVLLMIAGCLFPSEWIEENVRQSAEVLEKEDMWYKLGFSVIDNVADPLMVNEAYSVDYKKPIFSAFSVRKNYKEGLTEKQLKDLRGELITFQTPKEEMELIEIDGKLYSKDARTNYAVLTQEELEESTPKVIEVNGEVFYINEYNTCKELKRFVEGKVDTSVEYARYWHGYLPFLRVLLLFFNVTEIRTLFIVAFIILLIYMMILLKKEFGLSTALIFAFTLIWHDYLMVGYSLQCSPLFFVMMISTIIFIKKRNSLNKYLYLFVVGMVTSFVDYLTCPAIAFGMPLIIELLYMKKENKSFKDSLMVIIKSGIAWASGYAITWLTKWILYDILFNGEMLKVGITQFLYRASRSNIKKEINSLWDIMVTIVGWGFIGTSILTLIVLSDIEKFKTEKVFEDNLGLLILALIPFVWHIVLKNHTLLHWTFSFRDFVILQIIVLILLNDMVIFKSGRVKNEKNS
ncbi:MAG: hypothetical protein IJX99_04415 [Clostridia bacterium]|nr:hypothetical protein [Clostridia bacterium]